MIEYKLTANEGGQKIEKWLKKKFPAATLSTLFKLIRKKKIRVNGKVAKEDLQLLEFDQVQIFENIEILEQAQSETSERMEIPHQEQWVKNFIHVLDENSDYLVLNKPSGIASQPGTGIPTGKSLIELIWAYLKVTPNEFFKPALAHRIDQETSGVILACKTAAFVRQATESIRQRETHKEYRALVKGILTEKSGTIVASLARKDAKVGAKSEIDEEGLESITHYEVLEEFGSKATLIKVVIETGRMHQIRAHMAHIGHPLAGDDRYGDFKWNALLKKEIGLKRMFLHAFQFQLTDFIWTAPMGEDLEEPLAQLRF